MVSACSGRNVILNQGSWLAGVPWSGYALPRPQNVRKSPRPSGNPGPLGLFQTCPLRSPTKTHKCTPRQ
ncbi:hypothetical protein cgR_5024 [Corynebacterium glutamicum R]|uniref:Uncharacterized protein n=1 Tax=Corynebacterium glutamicum (strain R) TaxID=340322 RepID=A0AB72VAP2_CORGB|nr:hypothetical protein cgR_5024 [Corynebacterium glutamicum R]